MNGIVVRASQCLGVLLAVVVLQASAQPAPSLPDQRAADLAALDRFVRDSYAFLPTTATDWNRVISALMPRARAARDHTAWLHLLEEALDALYDGHTQLNTNAPDSWRPVPYGLWVQPNNGRYVVTAVQRGSLPERTGVRPGDELVAIDGVPVSQLYRVPPTAFPDACRRGCRRVGAGQRRRRPSQFALRGPHPKSRSRIGPDA